MDGLQAMWVEYSHVSQASAKTPNQPPTPPCCSMATGYNTHAQHIRDLLLAWRAWRAWVQYSASRKLQTFNRQRADHWYQQYYLYRRVFWGWQAAAKARYRLLMASRQEVVLQQKEEALKQQHAAEVEQLRWGPGCGGVM